MYILKSKFVRDWEEGGERGERGMGREEWGGRRERSVEGERGRSGEG